MTQQAASTIAVGGRHAPAPLRTWDCVTSAVIHDIKNSVSALSMLLGNAERHLGDPEFQRDAITTLSRIVERMQRALVRLSSASPLPTPAPVDLRELIMEATRPLASSSRIRLVRRLGPVRCLYADRDLLLRVIENLAANAVEAIEGEGTITVTLTEERGRAIISVADTGRGIPAEYRERHLFTPFRSTKEGGWGLGLSQVKQAVQSQGGEILVDSVEGLGTTFTVTLPLPADVESASLERVR